MKPSMRIRSARELQREHDSLEWWDGAVIGALFGAGTVVAVWIALDFGTLWLAKALMG